MSQLKPACPTCFEVMEEDHSCFAGPTPGSRIERDDRGNPVVVYDHPNLDIVEWDVALIFRIGVPKRYGKPDTPGIMGFIKERCEIPERPERQPVVEEYYMMGVRKVDD